MDHAQVLTELADEIKQIIEYHYELIRRARGGMESGRYTNEERYRQVKLYGKYAILIYSDALKEIDLMLEYLKKV